MYRVNEIFYSLQGEGYWTGTPAVFVRFSGCNLRCPFCDTQHQTYTEMSVDDILSSIAQALASVAEGCYLKTASADAPAPPIAGDGPLPLMRPRVATGFEAAPTSTSAAQLQSSFHGLSPEAQKSSFHGLSPKAQKSSFHGLSPKAQKSSFHGLSVESQRIILTGGEPGLQVDGALVEALHAAGYRVHIETNGTRMLPEGIDWVTLSPKVGGPVTLERADELKLLFCEGDDPAHWAAFPAQWHYLQPCDIAGDPAASRRNTAATIAYIQAHPFWRLSLQTHKLLGIR